MLWDFVEFILVTLVEILPIELVFGRDINNPSENKIAQI